MSVSVNPELDPDQEAQLNSRLVNDLDLKYAGAERLMRDTHRLWKENISFIEGMQWIKVRESAMLNVQGMSRNRIRIADNRLLDHARRLHARLDQVSYAPTVISDSLDDGDRQSARAAQGLVRWFERTKKVRKERRKINWWIVVCGQAYVECFFDPQGGPLVEVPETDEAGQPVQEQAVDDAGNPAFETITDELGQEVSQPIMRPKMKWEPAGDVDFLSRSPFSVMRDPRFQDWRKLRWLFVDELASKDEVIGRFGDLIPGLDKLLPQASYQTTPWMPELAAETSDIMGLPRHRPPVEDVVNIRRYYERPSREFPQGRFVIYAGVTVLYKGPMPTPNRDFPIVPFSYMGRPWFFEGKSAIDAAKSLQRLYNRILSRMAEHLVRLPAGWLLVPVTAGIPKRSFTNETGSIIRYVPGGGKPEFVFPPFGGLAWYDKFMGRLEASMEERMALPPAVRGQLPRGARAARTVELLQEAADQIQAPVLNDIAESWATFYEISLRFIHRHFSVDRIVGIIGEDKRTEANEFLGNVLARDWNDRLSVKVEAGESLPSSKMMRIEFILTLAQRHQFFGQPGTPEYIQRLSEALDLDAGFAKLEGDIDTSIAEDENIKLLRGDEDVHVRDYDDHIAHMRTHMQMMKRLVVSGREDQADKIFPHFSVHQQKLQALVAPKAKAAAAGPQPGGGGGDQMPPVTKAGGTAPQERVMENMAETVMGGGGSS